ncbi:SRPBCC family protein [Haloplanus rallus]|jgi:carbon monoxide dehydrogenase subunit G|uniref:SRPBCC family protein n=1 Tax=Haloplanus rallus TaxID=1816183 RepID=A0A6B9FE86_9EURY|nr:MULTISPECIES: SRPBCC family protein [Haloplanus]QGX95030.1 SRPBCC family protein [Haloplanus rallus]
MFTVEKRIRIDAPPAAVFSFLDDPRNHVKVTPSLVDIEDIEALPGGGKRAGYRYTLAGIELVGQVEDVERSPNGRLVQRLSGAIDGTIRYELDDEDGTTDLRYEAEYELPDTVVDSLLAPIAKAYNEREAKATLENLKTFLEA